MEIIIGKNAGFCYGVKRAVDGAIEECKKNEEIYCLGDIVHNQHVLDDLKAKGIIPILAHPERYAAYQKNPEKILKLKEMMKRKVKL